jgi:hypothetical protein
MSEGSNQNTPFAIRCNILAELWMDYRQQEDLQDFIQYNDLGLPLGFLVSEELVTANDKAITMINETFDLFLATLEIEDQGFESLDEMLSL